jgi:hypothetical protein
MNGHWGASLATFVKAGIGRHNFLDIFVEIEGARKNVHFIVFKIDEFATSTKSSATIY